MKNLLFIIFLLTSVRLFPQSKFVIDGKTNLLVNGKAIIYSSPTEFYPYKIKKDTVPVRKHVFVFTGILKYPERFRIEVIDKDHNSSLSEPFFISAGYHKMTIDKNTNPHDSLEVGYGVSLQNELANDEYIKKYLPLYNHVTQRYDDYERAWSKCKSIKDHKTKVGCELAAEAKRASIKKSSDNVLLTYAKANPISPIVPWLLYDQIFYHGYTDCYENVLQEIMAHTPAKINLSNKEVPAYTSDSMLVWLRNYLAKQKLKAPGYPFPLTDFIKANVPKNIAPSRYILVDFWYSGCGPCIAQFGELKNTYRKFHKKGFEIIAISIDRKETLPVYNKILEKNHYPWAQVLDLNGVRTKSMDVNSFPSGFLLDSHWKIVKTHINPTILNSFLEDNLL